LVLILMPQHGMPLSSPKPHNAIAARIPFSAEIARPLAPMNSS
jgi:hypothetical protein